MATDTKTTKKSPKFFIPQARPSETEAVYAHVKDVLKDQLRWPIGDRRIYGLKYTHDKKHLSVHVGELEAQSNRYTILAIYDSTLYIVYTRAANGGPGVTILINKDEVTEVIDFD